MLSDADFAASVSDEFKAALDDDAQLGRLDLSAVDGLDEEGKFTNLYSYGSRGFSFYDVTDFSRAYDSGDEIERVIAENYPSIFNSNPSSETDTPEGAIDTRSDNSVSSLIIYIQIEHGELQPIFVHHMWCY